MPCGNTRMSFWKQDSDIAEAKKEKSPYPPLKMAPEIKSPRKVNYVDMDRKPIILIPHRPEDYEEKPKDRYDFMLR